MKWYCSVLCCLCLVTSLPSASAQDVAVYTVEGRVLDAETGDPLPNVHVFLTHSTRGTTTDMNGYFRLDDMQAGTVEIAASMIGYELSTHRIQILGVSPPVSFELTPKVIALDEVVVSAERPAEWEMQLRYFKPLFLGTSSYASKCTILNPEVLSFAYDQASDIFQAEAIEPLIIENNALGYRLHYHLERFSAHQGEVRYLGTVRFDELEPQNKREQRRWDRRRREVYEGSAPHFLHALTQTSNASELRKVGFEVSLAPQFEENAALVIPADPASLVHSTGVPNTWLLSSRDPIQVVYRYDQMNSPLGGIPGSGVADNPQDYTSWIKLNNGLAEMDGFGHLNDPLSATMYGRWSYDRIAEALPREYVLKKK